MLEWAKLRKIDWKVRVFYADVEVFKGYNISKNDSMKIFYQVKNKILIEKRSASFWIQKLVSEERNLFEAVFDDFIKEKGVKKKCFVNLLQRWASFWKE